MNKRIVFSELKQILFPDDIKCVVCGREIAPNRYCLCDHCKLDLNENYCLRCGRHKIGIGDYCDECSEQILYFDEARSAVVYDGNAKSIVRRLKYGSARYLANVMSRYLLDVLLLNDWQIDCITYVPMHAKRERKRGYNQAKLLAEYLSDATDKECITLLEKTTSTVNQARLNRAERMENLSGTFKSVAVSPQHVLLIDDVMTTGSTVNECAKVLKKSGATVVYVLTFASVPEKPILDKPVQNIKDFRK